MLIEKLKAGIQINRDDLEDTADLEKWLKNAARRNKKTAANSLARSFLKLNLLIALINF